MKSNALSLFTFPSDRLAVDKRSSEKLANFRKDYEIGKIQRVDLKKAKRRIQKVDHAEVEVTKLPKNTLIVHRNEYFGTALRANNSAKQGSSRYMDSNNVREFIKIVKDTLHKLEIDTEILFQGNFKGDDEGYYQGGFYKKLVASAQSFPYTQKIYVKKNACLFCDKSYRKASKHYMESHKDEKQVDLICNLPYNSSERKSLLELLRLVGNFKHNLKVLKEKVGDIYVAKRTTDGSQASSDYIPCLYCLGFFYVKHLVYHLRKCRYKNVDVNIQNLINGYNLMHCLFGERMKIYSYVVKKLISDPHQLDCRKSCLGLNSDSDEEFPGTDNDDDCEDFSYNSNSDEDWEWCSSAGKKKLPDCSSWSRKRVYSGYSRSSNWKVTVKDIKSEPLTTDNHNLDIKSEPFTSDGQNIVIKNEPFSSDEQNVDIKIERVSDSEQNENLSLKPNENSNISGYPSSGFQNQGNIIEGAPNIFPNINRAHYHRKWDPVVKSKALKAFEMCLRAKRPPRKFECEKFLLENNVRDRSWKDLKTLIYNTYR